MTAAEADWLLIFGGAFLNRNFGTKDGTGKLLTAASLEAWRVFSPTSRNRIAPVPKAVKSTDGRWYWVECDQPPSMTSKPISQ